MRELDHIRELRDRGAAFFVSHSGGKDSQAMLAFVRKHVPDEQIVVIHADLPQADWPGTEAHIRATSPRGVEVIVCRSVKTFEDMVLKRGMFPSPSQRQCTSDLKRGPIKREIRRWVKRTRHSGLIVECMGLRAEESAARAKKCAKPFAFDKANSKAGREWYTWLPVASLTEREVFDLIEEAGQEPHWAYQAGMSRLSCMFCIMASSRDQACSARINADVYARYVALERLLDHTISMARRPLPEVTGVAPDEGKVRRHLEVLQNRRDELLEDN